MVSLNNFCVCAVCDVIWLSKLTDLSFSLPLYGCRSPPASFVPFWQSCALLFPRGHVLFHLFFSLFKSRFPARVTGFKKKKIRDLLDRKFFFPFCRRVLYVVLLLLLLVGPYEWVGFQCYNPLFQVQSVQHFDMKRERENNRNKTGASNAFVPFCCFLFFFSLRWPSASEKRLKTNKWFNHYVILYPVDLKTCFRI